MTAPLSLPRTPVSLPETVVRADEPVALLQLDATDPIEAASAVYREVRRGRRVVAVASGGVDAPDRLLAALDAIGVDAVSPSQGEALLTATVSVVPGPATAPRPAPEPEKILRVALAGCGVVGGGVLERLLKDARFQVVGVLVRDPGRARDTAIPAGLALTDPAALLAREPDVLVEVLSDASTGLALIRAALTRGIDVVSANKQAIGGDLAALTALAGSTGARLLYSASVGGGAPLIETVRRARAHGPVVRVEAVLNGTCNFILNRLADGVGFDDALTAAREAGFAEEDPTADLTGLDAAAKLAILAHEALDGTLSPEAVVRESLSGDAVLPAGRTRQLASLDVRSDRPRVTLHCAGDDALFADLPDEWNALRVTTGDGRTFTARGRGAGRRPTTESVWADLHTVHQASMA
ncbi:MAG: homoserine dehydrogenase [Brevundimonas sp.]|uniref:homoserine dehydrogenase n=1 Tax=Brevundimonas sp. TaxID=1871086 RepID=UPI004034C892